MYDTKRIIVLNAVRTDFASGAARTQTAGALNGAIHGAHAVRPWHSPKQAPADSFGLAARPARGALFRMCAFTCGSELQLVRPEASVGKPQVDDQPDTLLVIGSRFCARTSDQIQDPAGMRRAVPGRKQAVFERPCVPLTTQSGGLLAHAGPAQGGERRGAGPWLGRVAEETLAGASHLPAASKRAAARLMHLLSAYAVHDPETGYCQGCALFNHHPGGPGTCAHASLMEHMPANRIGL